MITTRGGRGRGRGHGHGHGHGQDGHGRTRDGRRQGRRGRGQLAIWRWTLRIRQRCTALRRRWHWFASNHERADDRSGLTFIRFLHTQARGVAPGSGMQLGPAVRVFRGCLAARRTLGPGAASSGSCRPGSLGRPWAPSTQARSGTGCRCRARSARASLARARGRVRHTLRPRRVIVQPRRRAGAMAARIARADTAVQAKRHAARGRSAAWSTPLDASRGGSWSRGRSAELPEGCPRARGSASRARPAIVAWAPIAGSAARRSDRRGTIAHALAVHPPRHLPAVVPLRDRRGVRPAEACRRAPQRRRSNAKQDRLACDPRLTADRARIIVTRSCLAPRPVTPSAVRVVARRNSNSSTRSSSRRSSRMTSPNGVEDGPCGRTSTAARSWPSRPSPASHEAA